MICYNKSLLYLRQETSQPNKTYSHSQNKAAIYYILNNLITPHPMEYGYQYMFNLRKTVNYARLSVAKVGD